MQHHFDTAIACKFGMLEAVIINHFEFWLEHNEKNGRNFYDGRYWTFNSMRAFAEIFPYASERKIRNALKHLEEEGILITGNYNKSTYDRTLWYAFSDLGKSILQKCQMEDAEMSNGNCKNVKPIPDNIHIIKTNDITDNNNGDKSPNIKSVSDNIKDVIDYLNLVCGTNYKSTTKATIEVIKARLKEGFTVDDFKSVIDKKHYEWGIDPKMSCYLRPQTLFGTKFESYLNQPYTDGRTLSESDKAMLRWAQTPREENPKDIDKLLLEGDMF